VKRGNAEEFGTPLTEKPFKNGEKG